jgi:hypothetical protein
MYSGEIIAGGQPRDFAVARHVRLGGSQRDIGHHIAGLAWANHGVRRQPGPDPAMTRGPAGLAGDPLAGPGETCGRRGDRRHRLAVC